MSDIMGAKGKKTIKIAVAGFIAAAVTALILIFCFTNVFMLYGNDRSMTEYRSAAETDEAYYYKTDECNAFTEFVRIDKATGKITVEQLENKFENGYGETPPEPDDASGATENDYWTDENGEEFITPAAPVVLEGNTFPRRSTSLAKNRLPLLQNIMEQHSQNGKLPIQYHATETDGEIYGFCNVYSGCVGYFAGGGNIGVEKILYTSFFKYDPQYNAITELLRVEGGNAVAYDNDTLIYYKNKKYYSQNLGGKPKFICDDLAFDSGATAYSRCRYFFDNKRLVIFQQKCFMNESKDFDYIAICDMDGNKLFEHKTKHTVTYLAIKKGE
ncbi:MAG: hypothetical protein K2L67_02975 [Clostridia bacterium]|nr:hypothetical protein [Clostridia bacterium]